MPAGTIKKDRFINKIRREMGFSHRQQKKRVDVYRNNLAFIMVPRKQLLAETWVRRTLAQHGVSSDDITEFLNAARV